MTPPLDKPSPTEAAPSQGEAWLDGFELFAEGYVERHPGAFERSPERRALYGDDRERELADLEAGTHPLRPR
jgi:hypothetical protein